LLPICRNVWCFIYSFVSVLLVGIAMVFHVHLIWASFFWGELQGCLTLRVTSLLTNPNLACCVSDPITALKGWSDAFSAHLGFSVSGFYLFIKCLF
jgi:hypothetical protein